MCEVYPAFPPNRVPWEVMRGNLSNISRPPNGFHEEESFHQLKDTFGHIHVCQSHFNKWMRCRRANPLSYDVTMVCRKFHEDYIECMYAEKKTVVYKTAKRLWRNYETKKSNNELNDKITRYKPIFATLK